MVSRLGLLGYYHSRGQPWSIHTNNISTVSDWVSHGQPIGRSVTSRDSSRDGFRSFGNGIPKLMKMAFSWCWGIPRCVFIVFRGLLGFVGTIFQNFWIRIPKLWDFCDIVRMPWAVTLTFKFLNQFLLNYIAGIFDLMTATGVSLPCLNLWAPCQISDGPPIVSTILPFCVVAHSSHS